MGAIFKTPAERDFQLAQKSRSTAQKSRTVWTAFNGLEIEGVWTVQIALIAGTKIEAVRTVQTAFKAVRFWAQKSRQHSVIFQARVSSCTEHLLLSVLYGFFCCSGHKNRGQNFFFCTEIKAEICCCFWHVFREKKCTEIEAAYARKTRQSAG